jgi:hypothetical protein
LRRKTIICSSDSSDSSADAVRGSAMAQYKYPQTDGQRNAETFSSDYNNREKNSQPWIRTTQIDFDRRIVTGYLAVDAGHHLR